jgi:hypothetical protein
MPEKQQNSCAADYSNSMYDCQRSAWMRERGSMTQ